MNTESPIFSRPDGKPLPPTHHLSLNPRGKFVLRLTIEAGSKIEVGKRVILQLRTANAAEAMSKRDAVVEAYKVAGILCRDVVIVEL